MKSQPRRSVLALSAVLAALTPAVEGSDVAFFFGAPGGAGSVEVHDEAGGGLIDAPAALQGVVLLPVDLVGRAALVRLDAAAPRVRADVAGASRIELGASGGSLYRYRRDETDGSAAFGWFHVGEDGSVQALLERAGTGPAGTVDPFLPKIAPRSDASGFLLATTVAGGGDLLEVDLAGAGVTDRTANEAPLDVFPDGIRMGVDAGAAVTVQGLWRFDSVAGAQALAVPFPLSIPAVLQGDLIVSADGSTFATPAGDSASQLDVYAFGATGSAVLVNAQPGAVLGVGALPAILDGPTFALSTDGSCCLWITETAGVRECFVAETAGTGATVQVTSDARFVDTLDSSGGVLPYRQDAFLVLVGEADENGGIDGADAYRVQLGAGGATTVTNVSLTSGDTLAPFESGGTLATEQGPWVLPDGETLLALADDGQSGGRSDLIALDAQTGSVQTLATAVREVLALEVAADRLAVVAARRPVGDVTECLVGPAEPLGALSLVASAGLELTLGALDVDPAGHLSCTVGLPLQEFLVRVDLTTNTAVLFTDLILPYGPALWTTAQGALALSVGLPGLPNGYGLWPQQGAPQLLPTGIRPGQVLPG